MALPSGADVKIGSYEFNLDRGDDSTAFGSRSYEHMRESLYTQQSDIEGSPGKAIANPAYLIWRYRDWSGGETQKFYDRSQPSMYWFGKCNPRSYPGVLTAVPDLNAGTSLTATSATPSKLVFAKGQGSLWLFANRQAFYTTDGIAWTAHASNPVVAAGYQITAAAGVRDEVWFSARDGTTRRTYKITTAALTQSVSDVTGPRFLGMSEKGGFIFGWTGRNLLRYNPQNTLPITQAARHKVYQPYNDNPTGTYYGDATASENAVYVLITYKGDSVVHEFRHNRGFPIWQLPEGFSGKALCYNMGVVYCLGEYGNKVALMGMTVQGRQQFHLADPIFASTPITAASLAASYGTQVIGTVNDGTTNFHFVYDATEDAVSELDEQTIASKGTADACATYDKKRVFAYFSGTTIKTDAYKQDFEAATGGFQWVSSAYDLDYPQDAKTLIGIEVTQDPTIGTATTQVEYQLDEDGTFTSAGTTTGGSKNTYFAVSTNASTKTFRQIRLRLTGTNGDKVFAVAVRAYINSYQEMWKLRLKMENESATEGPSNRRWPAWKARDYLLTTQAAKTVVAFLDGLRYPGKGASGAGGASGVESRGTAASVDVVIEDVSSVIFDGEKSEGRIDVTLRSVVP